MRALEYHSCPLVLQRFFKAVAVHHLFSTLTRWAQKQAPGSSSDCDQLVLQKSSCHHCLTSSITGRAQPVASVSSLTLCIKLVGQEPTLKAPSGRDITNACPLQVKFLSKSSFLLLSLNKAPSPCQDISPARGAFPGHKSPNGWYSCTILCHFSESPNKKPLK